MNFGKSKKINALYKGWNPENDSSSKPYDGPKHDDGDGEGEHDEYGSHDGGWRMDKLAFLRVRHNKGKFFQIIFSENFKIGWWIDSINKILVSWLTFWLIDWLIVLFIASLKNW